VSLKFAAAFLKEVFRPTAGPEKLVTEIDIETVFFAGRCDRSFVTAECPKLPVLCSFLFFPVISFQVFQESFHKLQRKRFWRQ
jgi:hypothetical protein